MTSHSVGFVYVLSNPSMPGQVKVGLTEETSSLLPEDRAQKLYTTAVPEPFDVVFRSMTCFPRAVERRAHELLAAHRVTSKREYFRVAPDVAIAAVRQAELEAGGIEAWTDEPIYPLKNGDRVALSLRKGQIFILMAYPDLFSNEGAAPIDQWEAHADGDLVEIMATNDPGMVAGLSDNDPLGEVDPVPFLNRDATAPNGAINGKERLVPGDRLMWLMEQEGTTGCTSVLFEARCHCQVVGRTWNPQVSSDGWPLLLQIPTVTEIPPTMIKPIRAALAMPRPRSWAPRQPDALGWAPVSTTSPPPEYWLPHLKATGSKRKASRQQNRPPSS